MQPCLEAVHCELQALSSNCWVHTYEDWNCQRAPRGRWRFRMLAHGIISSCFSQERACFGVWSMFTVQSALMHAAMVLIIYVDSAKIDV